MAGIVGSNYAGTNSLFANPANVVDSRFKVYVNLASFDYFVGNNALKWAAPYSLIGFAADKATSQRNKLWRSEYLEQTSNKFNKNFNNLLNVHGPAVLYTIDSKQAVAITSRGRSFINIKNVSDNLTTLILNPPDSPDRTAEGKNQNVNVNFNNTAELAFTYGRDISLNSEEAIKVAISVKRIIGLSNFHFVAKDSDYQLVTAFDRNGNITENVLNLQKLNVNYGYSDERTGLDDFSFRPGYWLGKPSPGRAIGFDLGISYEARPNIQKYSYRKKGLQYLDLTKNKYSYKLGASLVDIGRINFNNPVYVSNYINQSTNNLIFENNLRLFPVRRLVDGINQSLGTGGGDDINSFKSHLPTTLHLSADVHIYNDYYLQTHLVQNLHLGNGIGMSMPSSLSVVPRYETKWIELALPLSLLNNYQLLTLGLAGRFGPVFVGSDNLQGLFGILKPRGSNVYAGLNLPIYNKLPGSQLACYYDEKPSFGQKLKSFFKLKKKS